MRRRMLNSYQYGEKAWRNHVISVAAGESWRKSSKKAVMAGES
jgi:hypothetical protein